MMASQAFALKADFESVRKFHDKEVEQLLKDYTLEQSLTIRMELKRKDQELKDQKIVDIPGLYQKTGEADDRGLENILNLYERRVVIIKKREVSEKEIDLVKQALMERLFLPKETSFTTLDNIPTLDSAVKNLKYDFLFGAYETLIRGGQFLWIIIFSIGFVFAMWFLAKVWKAKTVGGGEGGAGAGGAGGGAGIGSSSSGDNHGDAETNIQADEFGIGKEININAKNSKAFETLNFESLCLNIENSFKALPGSTTFTLWSNFPDLYTQIQFYELIKIQNQVPENIRTATYKILDQVFDFKNRASKLPRSRKPKGLSQESLADLSIELARQKFMAPHDLYEKSILAIYPKYADGLEFVFDKLYLSHHLVLYKLYKEQFINYIAKIKTDDVMKKIDELIVFDPILSHPSDSNYKAFVDASAKLNLDDDKKNQNSGINPKMLAMVYQMPETDLDKIETMKTNEALRAQVPTFGWILLEDLKLLKDFFSNLSGPEMKYLIEFDAKFKEAMNKLDERALFRFNERMSKETHMTLDWRNFRDKIKKYYTYNPAGSNVQDVAKAS